MSGLSFRFRAGKLIITAVSETGSTSLCLECGLCCNGVIFADVELNSTEAKALKSKIGTLRPITTKGQRANARLPQPCAAFDGCRCRIYSERPNYCRQFECLLLKNVQARRLDRAAALRIIRTAQQRAEKVRRLLRELGDTDEAKALSHRFQRAAKQFEKAPLTDAKAQTYADLTLAVHDLNLLLREAFYPG
jgi:Fe-S-cluster containining protein